MKWWYHHFRKHPLLMNQTYLKTMESCLDDLYRWGIKLSQSFHVMITTRAAATFDTKIFQICFVPILSLSLITRPLKSYLIPNREVVLSSNYHFSTAFAVQLRGGIYIYKYSIHKLHWAINLPGFLVLESRPYQILTNKTLDQTCLETENSPNKPLF